MSRRRTSLSGDEARRIALAAQGFDRGRPAAPDDRRHYRRVMHSIGVLQLDFVNVLLPAHFLMVWSRLGAYDRERFEDYLYRSREYTEQWAHEASIGRVGDWPLLAHRRAEWTPWKRNPLRTLQDPEGYLQDILERIEGQGAVTANDLPEAESLPRGKPGEWHRPVQRWALEHHFGRGEVCVRERLRNFQRVYDLPERLIDDEHRQVSVTRDEAQRELLRQSAVSLGVATLQDLADYYRMSAREAAPRIEELVDEDVLLPVDVEGWRQQAYLSVDARCPREIPGASLLSPFDPLACSISNTASRFTCPRRSADGATTCCRSGSATGSWRASISRPTAGTGRCSSVARITSRALIAVRPKPRWAMSSRAWRPGSGSNP